MVFSAPQPDLLPKYLALIYPLQLEVWICVAMSVVVFSFLFYVIARVEGHILSWTFEGSFELKFIYSEKASKFCEIFTLLLTGTTYKSKVKISQNSVVFSE